ncbi:MAG: N-6 DNA methylase, partial [Candidatus Omnitrophica bacterium]|nr:N-6 DNA methylase [Candidatus Omnitrophota bacterium]
MLTQETKRHIDAARQVLVGVVPNPSSQIDQITNALIYKFMDDMDQSAIKAGGDPSFFVGNLERYAWTRLMDSRLGNQERMNLYSEALVKFSEAKQLPELFRGIFKSAFLPYRSPEVLGLFLKEIDYFDYSHSEELGTAYEYLLSIMGSQGDAGQFRTPRYIIDFIVSAVNPTKDDKVLDPACGTAGFLVSAYKHILEQHDGKNPDGSKNDEKPLTPDQRRSLMNNFEGYDVDPAMVRISQVNMYLHHFSNPKIYNYNTLSQDERWADKFDVILANPPFMSPKGGVSTHNKFSVPSSRSEVLFVDYIMNHLRPKGRAGIIVPEGIIFQSGTAHKQLRKNLIEDGLYAVVSLPSGVFQPYSGVKTSILLFNNELAKRSHEILFIDVKEIGVSLGVTRRPIEKNDLMPAISIIKNFQEGIPIELTRFAFTTEKSKILSFGYDLSLTKYRMRTDSDSEKPFIALSEVCNITKGKSSSTKTELGVYPLYLTAEECKTADHYDFDGVGVCVPLISATGHGKAAIKRVHFVKGRFALANLLAFLEPKEAQQLSAKYLFWVLDSAKDEMARLMNGAANVSMKTADLEGFQVPLPSIEFQKQIATELDGYQNMISGARRVVENWKPKIDIDPEWEKIELSKLCEFTQGVQIPQDEQVA